MILKNLIVILVGVVISLQAQAQTACETQNDQPTLSLVLTLDLSGSMSTEERSAQLLGYSEALRDPQVIENVLYCTCTEISVVLWADRTNIIQDFKKIKNKEDILSMAGLLSTLAQSTEYEVAGVGQQTEVFKALERSAKHMNENAQDTYDKAIIISGDGYDSRLYANLENLRKLKESNHSNGIRVDVVPIDLTPSYDFGEKSSADAVTNFMENGFESGSYASTPVDYPEVSDFYEQEVMTSDGSSSIAKDRNDLRRALGERLMENTCKPLS